MLRVDMSNPDLSREEMLEQQRRLYTEACPRPEDTPFFNHCMALAKAQGLSWMEGLEFVVRCRRGVAP
jgi:hypothetical protein